jgi:hypothetical protein
MKISFEFIYNQYDDLIIVCTEPETDIKGYGSSLDLALQDLISNLKDHRLTWDDPKTEEDERIKKILIENNICYGY